MNIPLDNPPQRPHSRHGLAVALVLLGVAIFVVTMLRAAVHLRLMSIGGWPWMRLIEVAWSAAVGIGLAAALGVCGYLIGRLGAKDDSPMAAPVLPPEASALGFADEGVSGDCPPVQIAPPETPLPQPDGAPPAPPTSSELSEASSADVAPESVLLDDGDGSVEAAVGHVEELMSLGMFDDAAKMADRLALRYPRDPTAQELLARVRREADAFGRQQQQRLFDEIDKACVARQWRTALTAARKLTAQFPDSSQAQDVAERMATLTQNARIEEVRQLRDNIRDLIERRRYGEAVAVAEDVLARFADTQAAAELRDQMRRLRELADKQA